MTRRGLAFAIPIEVAVLVIVPILVSQAGFPASAKETLEFYIGYADPEARAIHTTRASRPQNFSAALSQRAIGPSVRYHTFNPVPVPATSAAQNTPASMVASDDGRMPLPYPPSEAWCIRLNTGHLILVALHQDIYTGAWITHEIDEATASIVGCNFK